MADVFESNSVLDRERERLWELIAKTPSIDWQLLTKRPENVVSMVPWQGDFPENVWIGTSIESQQVADRRLPIVKQIPARIRFLSCEPLLERIDLDLTDIDWVIVGGESGHHCRRIDIDWVRQLRDNCLQSSTAFFFKQWGGRSIDTPPTD